jgi:Cu/Ag efflux pump CusA
MVEKLISLSLRNRYLVMLLAAGLFIWGIFEVTNNPIDAIPDVSENQVIVSTEFTGRSPQVIEDQVTYPLVSNLQGIPEVKNIRGTSMFGMSFIYIIYFYGINLSIALAIGFIALFGMAIETASLMNIYLNEAMEELIMKKWKSWVKIQPADILEYVIKGATKRLRPKIMTVSVSLFGLSPVLWSTGDGSDVMLPVTLLLIGGLLTSTVYVLLVTPVLFEMVKEHELKKHGVITVVGIEK